MIRICPKCLKAVVHYEKEYITGKISKQLRLSEELKYEFFENLKRFKRTHNEWKDYRVLEEALNSPSNNTFFIF
ncbi:hypothetical protein HNP87_001123 [Methanococcus maripaludis]|uniref:Uncharacterized protein n=1 Tax=Methanococcus maripaludis TaxID=39152 RepID=A0A7J9NJ50_METMI|nr:hypothetical protein [Methanococcus maripaludis]MBA2840591.1 hypothetical protein [Methanococcus maripaludis]